MFCAHLCYNWSTRITNTMTVLRIVFCVLAGLCVAATVPVGIFFEWWCIVPAVAAFAFALFMVMIKNASSRPAEKNHTDFMNTDEENEHIRSQSDNGETK